MTPSRWEAFNFTGSEIFFNLKNGVLLVSTVFEPVILETKIKKQAFLPDYITDRCLCIFSMHSIKF